jgi:HEAT repeat protein
VLENVVLFNDPMVTRRLATQVTTFAIASLLLIRQGYPLSSGRERPPSAPPEKTVAQKWQVDGIAAALDDPLLAVRHEAFSQLLSFSRVEGLPSSRIAEFLKDPDLRVRSSAVLALAMMQSTGELRHILKLLKDPAPFVRYTVVLTLARMQPKDQIPDLVKLLDDPNRSVRNAASFALIVLDATDQAPESAHLLKNRDKPNGLCGMALSFIEQTGNASDLFNLLKSGRCKDPRPQARVRTYRLDASKDELPIPKLVEMLKTVMSQAADSPPDVLST